MAETTLHKSQSSVAIDKMNQMRPAYLEINLKAFANNFNKIRGLLDKSSSLMAVVKANAYGHGLVPIAIAAEKCGADFLGVALTEEGEQLKRAGIKTPIVVLYPDLPERAARLVKADLMATACSWEYLESLNAAAQTFGRIVKVFLKLESGMARYGLPVSDLQKLAEAAGQLPSLKIIGISTNLADSSAHGSKLTSNQFSEFAAYLTNSSENHLDYRGIENSGGLLYNHHREHNLVRAGILLYGISPNALPVEGFQPVMSLKSLIIQIKKWPAGQPIGYGGHFNPKRDSLIATIPVGYADGYPWSLSNKGVALLHGKRVPVVGRVCMDALMLDATDVPEAKSGDEVVLLGQQGDQVIGAEELAKAAGSFSYELISRFTDRLPRIYVE
jgi:alanine racemase